LMTPILVDEATVRSGDTKAGERGQVRVSHP
jgi:hypothetical protein